jgi:hypothetical protein
MDDDGPWLITDWYGEKYMYKYISYPEQVSQAKHGVVADGFWVFTTTPGIFMQKCAHDVYSWLHTWGDAYFCITTPVFHKEGTSQFFSVVHKHHCKPLIINQREDILQQLISESCYAICNGMTLAIALHRLGVVTKQQICHDVSMYFDDIGTEVWYRHLPEEYNSLYIRSTMPHIADFPHIYACMGAQKASTELMNILFYKYDMLQEQSIVTGISPNRCIYYTSRTASALPYVSQRLRHVFDIEKLVCKDLTSVITNDDTSLHAPDLFGILSNVVASRGMTKWWRKGAGRRIIESVIELLDSKTVALTFILKRLFYLYDQNNFPKSRIRSIWNGILCMRDVYSKEDIHTWLQKYLIVRDIKNTSGTKSWFPYPPVAFMWDIVNIAHIDIFHRQHSRSMSLVEIMKRFNDNDVATFLSVVQLKIRGRMTTMKAWCGHNASAWHVLRNYFEGHPQSLYT